MRSRPLRFSPTGPQLLALDAVAGAAAVTLAMVLRFVDEGSIPATYAQRLAPWLVIAAAIQILAGEVMTRLRRPRSVLAHRPVLPFVLGAIVGLLLVTIVNDGVLREPLWHLPHFVSIVAPILASVASAALRLASARSIELDELLNRPIVTLDVQACAPALAGKRVLITGAAGSIGAELARQLLSIGPADVLGVDTNETGLYELERDIPGVRTCIADVSDARRMRELFVRERPQVVFHAAAYKHVPLVEANPDQGFSTNVLGTLAVCLAAIEAEAERVVVISTDKAVNPSSFMGLTKRVAELLVIALSDSRTLVSTVRISASVSREDSSLSDEPQSSASLSREDFSLPDEPQTPKSRTVVSAVRFGNVLGSRGSVVPTLLRQIEAGGPITITHRDAQRFFMTVSEAAGLVLLSAAYGAQGGVFVLDMGDEVSIEQMAERLIRLKGLRPGRDVAIRYIGLRAGEKLREELHSADERLIPTERASVWRVDGSAEVDSSVLLDGIRSLEARRQTGDVDPREYPSLLRSLIARAENQVQVAELVPQVPFA